MGGCKIAKFVKVISIKSFLLYGIGITEVTLRSLALILDGKPFKMFIAMLLTVMTTCNVLIE